MSEIDSASPLAGFPEYQLLRPLGRGAMGEVYLAHDPLLDRPVAVKFIAQLDADPRARDRFFTEARAVARLCHPNVVSIYRVGEWEGRPFLISEFVRGQGLERLPRPQPSAEVLRLGIGLSRGLGAAHRRGVLHRDIKPANAILGEDGEVKLLDFGLAKILDGSQDDSGTTDRGVSDAEALALPSSPTVSFHDAERSAPSSVRGSGAGSQRPDVTMPGSILGSPLYMSPEVWRGEAATRRSDVYALGILLYELCAGKAPHHGVPFLTLSRLVQETDVAPVLQAAPTADPRLCEIIDRCVRRTPGERFESGDALREALEALEAGLRPRPQSMAGLPEGNPYRGLGTFEEEHRGFFFGRSREVRAVLERLRAEPFVLVAGDSGVGKSSLCRAGVLPQLSGVTVRLVPGRRPAASFAAALAPLVFEEELAKDPLRDPAALGRRLRQLHPGGVTLFIDQMEELLTLGDPKEAGEVTEALDLLLATTPGLRLLGTVRGDFLTRLLSLPGLGREVQRALFLLSPLKDEDLTEAIVGPARALGFAFESPVLLATLVASAGSAEGGLPLLQFALAELWEARDKERRVIPQAALHAMGGVGGALARHGDGVLQRLLPAQREAARDLLGRLITAEGTRARRTERELCGEPGSDRSGDVKAALSALVQGRLLVARPAGDGEQASAYELAHEALLSGWGTLKGWLLSDLERRLLRQRLEQAAAEWERLEELPELLWGERQLGEARALLRESLPPREAAFLRAAQRGIKRRRLLRYGLLTVGPLSLLLFYGGVQLAERRALGRRVEAHLVDARATLAAARDKDRTAAAERSAALSLFDRRERDDGEAAWEQALLAERQAARTYERASRALETALMLDSGRRDVRELLAEVLYARLLLLERLHKGDGQEELRARLQLHDEGGRWLARLSAKAVLRVETTPKDAAITAFRYEDGEDHVRRLVPIQAAPEMDGARHLAPGSYLLSLSAPGRATVRYPVLLRRGEERALRVLLPMPAAVPPGFVYVPPGRALFGSAADESLRRGFFEAVPLHEVETGAYLIAQRETTFGDWLAYLRALPAEERALRSPRAASAGMHGSLELRALPEGTYSLLLQPTTQALFAKEGEPLRYPGRTLRAAQDWLRMPILGISWEDAQAYAAWLDRTQKVRGARLCSEIEWERAARGADDRLYPHGDRLLPDDANFDRSYGKQPLAFGPDEVGVHPASRSPFHVDDMTGNAWEWVRSSVSAREAVARGGGYYHSDRSGALTNRQESEPTARNPMIGMRLCATWQGGAE